MPVTGDLTLPEITIVSPMLYEYLSVVTVIDEVGAWLVDCIALDVELTIVILDVELLTVILDSPCSRYMIVVIIATITTLVEIRILPFMI